jgi:hypothetical protein
VHQEDAGQAVIEVEGRERGFERGAAGALHFPAPGFASHGPCEARGARAPRARSTRARRCKHGRRDYEARTRCEQVYRECIVAEAHSRHGNDDRAMNLAILAGFGPRGLSGGGASVPRSPRGATRESPRGRDSIANPRRALALRENAARGLARRYSESPTLRRASRQFFEPRANSRHVRGRSS